MKEKKTFIISVLCIILMGVFVFSFSEKSLCFEGVLTQNAISTPATLTVNCKRYEQWLLANEKEVSFEVNIDPTDKRGVTSVSYEIMSGRFLSVENNFFYGTGSIYDKQMNEFIFSEIYFDSDYKQCVFVCEKDDIVYVSGEDEFVAEINRFRGK